MKKLIYILGIILIFTGCTEEDEIDYSGNQNISNIRVSAENFSYSHPNGTRGLSDNVLNFKWGAADTIGIFPEKGGQLGLPMTAGNGVDNQINFDGGAWALNQSCSYSAYFPFKGDMYLERTQIPVNFTGQKQNGNGSAAHLVQYDYMATGSTIPAGDLLALNFKHLGAVLEIQITTPEPMGLQTIEISADTAAFVQTGTFNPTDSVQGINAVTKSSRVRLDLEEMQTTGESLIAKIYCMAAPVNLSGQTLHIKAADIFGNVQTITVPGEDFQAGKVYALSAGLEKEELQGKSYQVDVPGSLPELIGEADKYNITSLKLSGSLNGTDMRFIREMAGLNFDADDTTEGKLKVLDMQEARIVSGGERYINDETCYTQDDVLGLYMFGSTRLERVLLPKNLLKIDEMAFAECDSLKSVSIPSTVKDIADEAFYACRNLESAHLPQNLEHIGERAFRTCVKLQSVSFPSGLREIGKMAFLNCRSVKSIALPAGLKSIGSWTFESCAQLEDLVLSEGLESIGYEAFRSCKSLKEVHLPDGLKSIGSGAFSNCKNLSSITLPASVDDMKDEAFAGCENLEKVDLSACGLTEIRSDCFYSCSKLKDLALPKGITEIWNEAFGECVALENVNLPDGLNGINWEAFIGCTALKRIVIPGSVTELVRSFVGCTGLKEVIICCSL